jgi:hypothetical protein
MNKDYDWIAATLLNDEAATDEEIIAYFMTEGRMEKAEAEFYVKQRSRALLEDLGFELYAYDIGDSDNGDESN